MAVQERGEQALREMQQGTVFEKRQRCSGVSFTHDSLLQTLQVLFGLLMALMQESDRNSKTNTRCFFLCTSGQCNTYVLFRVRETEVCQFCRQINCNNEEHQESFLFSSCT